MKTHLDVKNFELCTLPSSLVTKIKQYGRLKRMVTNTDIFIIHRATTTRHMGGGVGLVGFRNTSKRSGIRHKFTSS